MSRPSRAAVGEEFEAFCPFGLGQYQLRATEGRVIPESALHCTFLSISSSVGELWYISVASQIQRDCETEKAPGTAASYIRHTPLERRANTIYQHPDRQVYTQISPILQQDRKLRRSRFGRHRASAIAQQRCAIFDPSQKGNRSNRSSLRESKLRISSRA